MPVMNSKLVDSITKRLAREPDWAESELGKTLALIVDTAAVSLPILSDYTGIPERSVYRWIESTSGQPRIAKVRQHELKAFNDKMQSFRSALTEAHAADAFKELHGQWYGKQEFSGRDEALRILLTYAPKIETEQ